MSLTNGNPWRARITRSSNFRDAEVLIARVGHHDNHFVTEIRAGGDTVLTTVEEGALSPSPLQLPYDVLEPLRDALDEFLGKPKDDFRAKYEEARDALAVERRRVDDLLAR